jgi:hypothetical protein
VKTILTNNLISLLDQTFPDLKTLFTSPAREKDGHEKRLDFAAKFWRRRPRRRTLRSLLSR